jgi:HAD superfamily hydrolase (TIGR01509 family)
MPSIELIIFDCDGVLVDSEPIVNRLFVEMLGELGYHLDYERTLRESSGGTMAMRMSSTQQRLGWQPPADFTAQFDRRLSAALQRELRPVPGVRALLADLLVPWCVASNGSHDDVRSRLDYAGLLAEFDPPAFSATEVAVGKPAPDLFLHAAARMTTRPDRCVVVEDSVPGVRAGVAAGMPVFGLARLTNPGDLREAGATVFEDMSELPGLLRTIRSRG